MIETKAERRYPYNFGYTLEFHYQDNVYICARYLSGGNILSYLEEKAH